MVPYRFLHSAITSGYFFSVYVCMYVCSVFDRAFGEFKIQDWVDICQGWMGTWEAGSTRIDDIAMQFLGLNSLIVLLKWKMTE